MPTGGGAVPTALGARLGPPRGAHPGVGAGRGGEGVGHAIPFLPMSARWSLPPPPHTHTRGLAGALLQSGILELRNAGCQGPQKENRLWPLTVMSKQRSTPGTLGPVRSCPRAGQEGGPIPPPGLSVFPAFHHAEISIIDFSFALVQIYVDVQVQLGGEAF